MQLLQINKSEHTGKFLKKKKFFAIPEWIEGTVDSTKVFMLWPWDNQQDRSEPIPQNFDLLHHVEVFPPNASKRQTKPAQESK